MNIISRFVNLIKGFFTEAVSGVERNNPEVVYRNARELHIKNLERAKNASAQLLAGRIKLEEKLKADRARLAQAEADLEAALDTEQDQMAELLVGRVEELRASVTEEEGELLSLSGQIEEVMQTLRAQEESIRKLDSERDKMLTKHAVAKSRVAVQESLNGLSVTPEIQALEEVRKDINKLVAKAQINDELSGASLDAQLAKMRQEAGNMSAKRKVAALKAARQAAADGQQKTL